MLATHDRSVALLTVAIALAACGGSSPPPDATPGTLATNLKRPWAIAVDSKSVYWITLGSDANNLSDGAVMKAGLDGSDVVALISPVVSPSAIALDATHVYWSTYGVNQPAYLMKAALDGTNVTTIVTLPTSSPTEIAVDASSIYWTNVFAGTVNKANLDGTGVTVLASSQLSPAGIVVDATSVYWVNGGVNSTLGSVTKCSLTGTNLTTLAADQPYPVGLAVDATHVYWGTSDSESTGSIHRVALDGSGATTLATGAYVDPWSIAAAPDAVYWLDSGNGYIVDGMTVGDGAVMRVGLDGTAVTVLAPQQPNPRGIAVGANDVFWATEGTNEGAYQDGTIRRVAR